MSCCPKLYQEPSFFSEDLTMANRRRACVLASSVVLPWVGLAGSVSQQSTPAQGLQTDHSYSFPRGLSLCSPLSKQGLGLLYSVAKLFLTSTLLVLQFPSLQVLGKLAGAPSIHVASLLLPKALASPSSFGEISMGITGEDRDN